MTKRSLTILMAFALLMAACAGADDHAGEGWLGDEPDWSRESADAVGGVAPPEGDYATTTMVDGFSDGVAAQQLGLKAGSVDDNAAWDDYLLYRQQFLETGIPVHDIDVAGRRIITVMRPDQSPVLGATVTLFDDQGNETARVMTSSDGRALVFPQGDVDGMEVVATQDGLEARASLTADMREHTLTLDAAANSTPIRLDVLFLIDVTGSMGDEINRLKSTIDAIAARIDDLPVATELRLAMTVYRDREDAFVTRTFDFTPDVALFSEALAEVTADGGGDYPESLNEALHEAVATPEWRVDDTVSLIFLVADAPPVLTYAQDYDYAVEMLAAAERGITIHPVASSGLDDQGEYVFRQIAQATGGRFVFLTYGAGGEPGDSTTHHVDDYSVLSLDDLVVRIVEETLAPLAG